MGRARDKIAAIKWAQKLVSSDDWVVLNTQSTGFTEAAVAVEIAVVSNTGELLFHSPIQLPKHKRPQKNDLERLGRTRKELMVGPTYSEVAEQLSGHLTGKKVVTYNKNFRSTLLRTTANEIISKGERVKALGINWETCLMERYSAFVGKWMKNDFTKSYGYKWQKLPKTEGEDGVVAGCQAALRLIQKMAEEPLPKIESKPKSAGSKNAGCLTSLALCFATVLLFMAVF